MISRMDTPSKRLSRRDQCVTQWMSQVTSVRGSARSSSHVKVTASSTRPTHRKDHVRGSKRGVRP